MNPLGRSPRRKAIHVATVIEYDWNGNRWFVVALRDVIVFNLCGHPANHRALTRPQPCFSCGASAL